jgi:Na+/H+ antiporter NhaD/arsenite permease-like protein
MLTYTGLSFGGFPYFRIDRTGIALIGGTAVVAFGIISFDEAIRAIDFNTIILLLGMMILSTNLKLAGFFALVSSFIKKYFENPALLLASVIFFSGFLSALYVNDTICIFFTPFLLEMTFALSLNPVPYLIALATASNIGSLATITGNPQNMLIGIFSGISYNDFALKLSPSAFLGLAADFLVLYLIYRKKLIYPETKSKITVNRIVHKALLYKTLAVTAIMFVFLFAGYNISLVAISAAALLLITRRVKPDKVYQNINWNLLMMFCGLFVVISAVEKTGLSAIFFEGAMKYNIHNETIFAGVMAVLSNLVSNVPAVVLFKPLMNYFPDPEKFWLILAMASTFAGNLTIIGSVANLIVVEQSKKHVKIGFFEYMKAGVPVTIISMVIGILMLRA